MPTAAAMNITNVVGSGTLAFALAPEPKPDGSLKLDRQRVSIAEYSHFAENTDIAVCFETHDSLRIPRKQREDVNFRDGYLLPRKCAAEASGCAIRFVPTSNGSEVSLVLVLANATICETFRHCNSVHAGSKRKQFLRGGDYF